MNSEIKSIKKRQIDQLKRELRRASGEHTINYLKKCIEHLEREIFGKKETRINENKTITDLLITAGFDDEESFILSVLLCNDSVKATYFATRLNIQRTKIYRLLNKFEKEEIVGKINNDITKFFIINKENPFEKLLDSKYSEVKNLVDATKKITTLLRE